MICFYHADNDGKCAGFWVNKCGLIDKHGKTLIVRSLPQNMAVAVTKELPVVVLKN